MWQDLLFGIGGFIFCVALIPTIIGRTKPAFMSSVMTAGILGIYLLCYASLDLWLGFASGALTTIAWVILAIQKKAQSKSLHSLRDGREKER
jgi:hypothetical protein